MRHARAGSRAQAGSEQWEGHVSILACLQWVSLTTKTWLSVGRSMAGDQCSSGQGMEEPSSMPNPPEPC